MKICSKCQKLLPLTDFNKNQYNCKLCKKELFSIYSQKISRKEQKQKYYKENKEKILASEKLKYQKNKDIILDKRKEYRLIKKDVIDERTKQWKELNKDHYKQYHREYMRNYKNK